VVCGEPFKHFATENMLTPIAETSVAKPPMHGLHDTRTNTLSKYKVVSSDDDDDEEHHPQSKNFNTLT
jgi:hypothetical protein